MEAGEAAEAVAEAAAEAAEEAEIEAEAEVDVAAEAYAEAAVEARTTILLPICGRSAVSRKRRALPPHRGLAPIGKRRR